MDKDFLGINMELITVAIVVMGLTILVISFLAQVAWATEKYQCYETQTTPNPTPTEIPRESDPWDCSKDHSCPATNSPPAQAAWVGDTKAPPMPLCLTGVSNDGKLTIKWWPNNQFPYAHIKYWDVKNPKVEYSKLNVDNDGADEISHLTNGVYYQAAVAYVSSKDNGAYVTPWSQGCADPLP